MADRVGQQFGNYRLLRLIGHGGFADVYLGEHIYMGTQAAIKLLHTQVESRDIERFQQEARTIARLEHPHIVRVLEYGVEETVPFLVLSYAPNGTLRERHPRGTVLSLPIILEYVWQVADALQYAHDGKVIHRDIKPENMLVGRRNEILLTDFGIALVMQNSHSVNPKDLAGTAAYMSPEQVEAHPRAASDQYSLAVVVYEWLSGTYPFQGTFAEVALKHLAAPIPSLREKVPTLSASVEEVVFTALAKDPAKRFASIQAFARALEAASRDGASSVTVLPSLEKEFDTLRVPTSPDKMSPVIAAQPSLTPVLPVSGGPVTPLPLPIMPVENRFPEPHTDSPAPLRRRYFSRGWTILLVVLALLVVGGGVLGSLFIFHPPVGPGQTPPKTYDAAVMANGIMFGFDAQHTHFNPYEDILGSEHVTTVQEAWAFSAGAPIGLSSAVVAYGLVYIAAHDGKLHTFDVRNGQGGWISVAMGKGPIEASIESSPAVSNGIVYIGARDGKLHAFDAQTSQQKWAVPAGGIIDSSPTIIGGVVYIGSEDHNLYAFNAQNGHLIRTFPTHGIIANSSPAVANGVVYIGSEDGKLYAFNIASGQQLWAEPTTGGIYSSPAVVNGVVYVSSSDEKLYAFDARTGRQKWAKPTGGKPTGGVIFSSPAVANGVVYIGSLDDKLYAFDANTGTRRWAVSTGGSIEGSPIVANGLVYIGSLDDKLYAFDAASGHIKWSLPTGGRIYSSPMVANGVIYVGTADGRMYAFRGKL